MHINQAVQLWLGTRYRRMNDQSFISAAVSECSRYDFETDPEETLCSEKRDAAFMISF